MVWKFFVFRLCSFTEVEGLYGKVAKVGDFLETFLPEGTKFFYRGLFKGSQKFYY